MAYEEGNAVRIQSLFTNETGTPIDPTTVHFQIFGPTLNVSYTYGTDVQIVRTAVGVYQVDVDTTNGMGHWEYRVWSTGLGQASHRNTFSVEKPFL